MTKTSIQARQHATFTPTGSGEPAHLEHTYARRGAVNLIAGLNVLTGRVYGEIHKAKTFQSFALFLTSLINQAVDDGKRTIHLLLDNGSIHRPKRLSTWLAENFPDVVVEVHWLPVRSSWLNQVEIFFSLLQTQALTPNDFSDTTATSNRILGYIAWHNRMPRPMNWNYNADALYRKYGRARTPAVEASTQPELRKIA